MRNRWKILLGRTRTLLGQNDRDMLIEEFVNLRRWAVVGYSANPEKYGNRIYHDLSNAGYRVYPVNLKGGRAGEQRVYPNLSEIPEPPEVVDIVVPPAETEAVLRDCVELGLRRVWLQPGAESQAALRFARRNGLKVVHDACAMVEKKFWDAAE